MIPIGEIAYYFQHCDPDTAATCAGIYSNPTQAQQAAAECGYIKIHHALPEWAIFLDGFEEVNGAFIFVHKDPARRSG